MENSLVFEALGTGAQTNMKLNGDHHFGDGNEPSMKPSTRNK